MLASSISPNRTQECSYERITGKFARGFQETDRTPSSPGSLMS
jgi:hypothetical protein